MYKSKHFYCVHPDWQQDYASEYGGIVLKNKIIQVPISLGEGHTFFSQVIPGIALLFMDFTIESQIKIKRIEEEVDRCIFHYDLSEHHNYLIINNKKNKIGSTNNKGIAIFSNQIESYFEPTVGKRTFVLRLFVDKKLMLSFLEDITITHNDLKRKLTNNKKDAFLDDIDANSILLMNLIKERSVFQESFDAFIKGIALQLLGGFFKKYSQSQADKNKLNQAEIERLIIAKNYLFSNLNEKFPSIALLSKIAGMSPTKFKVLFRKYFNNTCKKMFIQEKMNLAYKMLQSGQYNSITDIADEMQYNQLQHFTLKYLEIFKKKPSDDFIRKDNLIK